MRSKIAHNFRRCGKGPGRNDHMIVLGYAERLKREVEGGGGGVDSQRMPRTNRAGKGLFECFGLRPGGEPAAAQRIHYSLDLPLADTRQCERNFERLRSA